LVSPCVECERTPLVLTLHVVYMYFQGLSLRAVSACLEDLCPQSHVSVWNWVQRFSQLNSFFMVRHVRYFMVDETWVEMGGQEAWLRLTFEPYSKLFLGFHLSRTRKARVLLVQCERRACCHLFWFIRHFCTFSNNASSCRRTLWFRDSPAVR